MEQKETTQYLLRNGLLVDVLEDMALPFVTIERAVMSFYGYSEELDDANGIAIWRDIESGQRRFITARRDGMTHDEMAKMAQSFECPVMQLLDDPSIAQDLIKDMGLHITPQAFVNGSLTGKWRVERISRYMPWNREVSGIITGINQPVAAESTNLLHAIYAVSCRVMGLGKLAYVHFPKGPDGGADVIASDFELVGQFAEFLDKTVFRAPVLDKYITCSIPDDVKAEAVATARAQCRAAISAVQEDKPVAHAE